MSHEDTRNRNWNPLRYRGEEMPWNMVVTKHAVERLCGNRFRTSIEKQDVFRACVSSLYFRLWLECQRHLWQWWLPIFMRDGNSPVYGWACLRKDTPSSYETEATLVVTTVMDEQYGHVREALMDMSVHPAAAKTLILNQEMLKKQGFDPLQFLRMDLEDRFR